MSAREIGAVSGELMPCPSSPNCVLTTFEYAPTEPEEALGRIVTILENEKRCRVITVQREQPFYVHAEFRSFLFRFVDDVEFLFLPEPGRVQVRSASRVGDHDMGVNATRVERLRSLFAMVR